MKVAGCATLPRDPNNRHWSLTVFKTSGEAIEGYPPAPPHFHDDFRSKLQGLQNSIFLQPLQLCYLVHHFRERCKQLNISSQKLRVPATRPAQPRQSKKTIPSPSKFKTKFSGHAWRVYFWQLNTWGYYTSHLKHMLKSMERSYMLLGSEADSLKLPLPPLLWFIHCCWVHHHFNCNSSSWGEPHYHHKIQSPWDCSQCKCSSQFLWNLLHYLSPVSLEIPREDSRGQNGSILEWHLNVKWFLQRVFVLINLISIY